MYRKSLRRSLRAGLRDDRARWARYVALRDAAEKCTTCPPLGASVDASRAEYRRCAGCGRAV